MLNKIFLIICTLLLSTVVVADGEQKVISADATNANDVQLLEKRLFEPFIERFNQAK